MCAGQRAKNMDDSFFAEYLVHDLVLTIDAARAINWNDAPPYVSFKRRG